MCQQSFEFHRFSSLTSFIDDGKALRKENTMIRISCTKWGTCCIMWISNGYLINYDCTEVCTERAAYVCNQLQLHYSYAWVSRTCYLNLLWIKCSQSFRNCLNNFGKIWKSKVSITSPVYWIQSPKTTQILILVNL